MIAIVARRIGEAEQFQQLVGDALARQGHQIVGARGAGVERGRVRLAGSEARVEAEEAQDPQMVLGDALQRVADEADVPVLEDRRARRNNRRSRRSRGSADSALMVKSRRAASSFQSSVKATVARRPSVDTSRRSVVISNGWPSLTAVTVPWSIPVGTALILRLLEPRDHFVGRDPGGKIDVADRQAEQIVAHRAADVARQPLVGAERRQQPLMPRCLRHFGGVEVQLHCSLRDRLTIIAAVAPQILRSFHMIS